MKKFLIAALALFASVGVARAEPLNVVNPGSDTGAFRQALTMLGEEFDHVFMQAGNPVIASQQLDLGPAFTVWSSEWPGNPDLPPVSIHGENLVALMTYETMVCSREFTSLEKMHGKEVKLATWGSPAAAKFLGILGDQLNVDFVVVPYSGSGSTTKGYIAGDADTVFTIESRRSAIEADPKTKCFAFSKDGMIGFRFVDAYFTVDTDKDTTLDLQDVFRRVSQTEEWKKAFDGSTVYVVGDYMAGELIGRFDEAVTYFSK